MIISHIKNLLNVGFGVIVVATKTYFGKSCQFDSPPFSRTEVIEIVRHLERLSSAGNILTSIPLKPYLYMQLVCLPLKKQLGIN